MSEAKSSKKRSKAKTESAPKAESAPKTESAPKAEAKSESADATPKAKDDAASTPPESSSTDTTSSDGAKDAGNDAAKSAREAVGGKSEVHYGYFSSVRTPEYRSGWDSIWGNRNGTNGEEEDDVPRQRQAAHAGRPAKARKRREPITVTLDLDALPPALKDGLVEIARAELKKSRVSYERRDKAGAIDWRITCRVD